jgi:GntR family transcriptional regulator/MocR family aminotransferase
LGRYFYLDTSNPGLHLIAHITKEGLIDVQLEKMLLDHNILVHALSKYYVHHNGENGLVMGFCCVNPKQIKESINKMERVISHLLG